MITVAVEGDTDVVFVSRLCEESGFAMRTPLVGRTGKGSLLEIIEGFARAGKGGPHLVVRDLDNDANCPGEWISRNAPKEAGPFFALRLAVRAVEAWFLADRDHAARSLRVAPNRIPNVPDNEPDPEIDDRVSRAHIDKTFDSTRYCTGRGSLKKGWSRLRGMADRCGPGLVLRACSTKQSKPGSRARTIKAFARTLGVPHRLTPFP